MSVDVNIHMYVYNNKYKFVFIIVCVQRNFHLTLPLECEVFSPSLPRHAHTLLVCGDIHATLTWNTNQTWFV